MSKRIEVIREYAPSPFVTIAIGSLGGLIFGYDTGIMAVATDLVIAEFNVDKNNTVLQGFITSVILFGAALGSLGGGFLAQYGRRVSCFIAAGICLFGGVTTAFSPTLWVFMTLRFILGIGVGLVGVICPMYVSETAPQKSKGRFGVLFQLSLTLGILLAYVVGFGFKQIEDQSLALRLMLGTGGGIFPLLMMCVIFCGMIETVNYQRSTNDSETRHLSSQDSSTIKRNRGALSLFSMARIRQTIKGIVLAVILQLTGINAIMYYGPKIIEGAGFHNATLLNVGIGVWNFLSTFIAVSLVGLLERRTLIIGGTVVMSLALILVGLCLNDSIIRDPLAKGIGVGIGLALFIAGFEGGIGCLFWVLVNEIFDSDVREHGSSMCNVMQWLFNILVSSLFPLLFEKKDLTFYVFGGIGILCTLYYVIESQFRRKEHTQTLN